MILLCKLAAAVFVAAVLTLLLKKDQPAFAFLVSACTAAGLLAVVVQQVGPWLDWLRTLDVYFQGQSPAVLLRVLGIALVAQFAADTCKEAGLSAAATAVATVGTALGYEFFAAKARNAIAAFAALNFNAGFVNEFHLKTVRKNLNGSLRLKRQPHQTA